MADASASASASAFNTTTPANLTTAVANTTDSASASNPTAPANLTTPVSKPTAVANTTASTDNPTTASAYGAKPTTAAANTTGYFLTPDLPVGVISDILLRLPAMEDLYRVSAVCQAWRPWGEVRYTPEFLSSYLAPLPLPIPLDGPGAVIFQPKRLIDLGYTHVSVVSTTQKGEDGVLVGFSASGNPVDGELAPIKGVEDLADEAPVQAVGELYSNMVGIFFRHTMRALDLAVVASHDNLLLCRSSSSYYVCDAAANRCLQVPKSEDILKPVHHTHVGFHYHVTEEKLVFQIVLLAKIEGQRIAVDKFRSNTAEWEHVELNTPDAARCLGLPGPGVHTSAGFCWLGLPGHLIIYDCTTCEVAVKPEPMQAQNDLRTSKTLACDNGKLRLCAFEYDEDEERFRGRIMVWEAEGPRSEWQTVHNAAWKGLWIDDITSCGSFLVLKYGRSLLRYELLTATTTEIARFGRANREESQLDNLYEAFSPFPLYTGHV